MSIKLMSKLLKRNFYVEWSVEDIKKYIDYSKYDFEKISTDSKDVKTYGYIDLNYSIAKKYLMNEANLYPDRTNIFHTNQEISQYLYKNKLFLKEDYLSDILNEYSTLYKDILIPTDYLNNRINTLISDKSKIVGIQVRCGDRYMSNCGPWGCQFNVISNIEDKLEKIKILCNNILNDDYYVFITTDYIKVVDYVHEKFDKSKVIYNDDCIQHIDRKSIHSDISKVFVDNYVLSQKTDLLFISTHSNYGRVAALSSSHDNIFDFDTCEPVPKRNILSKNEHLFN